MTTTGERFTADQVCTVLGISPRTLRLWRTKGYVHRYPDGYDPSEVAAHFLATMGNRHVQAARKRWSNTPPEDPVVA